MNRKTALFEWCSWFKLNNLQLALGMASKFYTEVKVLKLKVWEFFGLISTISTFVEVIGTKQLGDTFAIPAHPE